MQEISFSVEGEFVELNQLLKLTGLCDSGGAGKMIENQVSQVVDVELAGINHQVGGIADHLERFPFRRNGLPQRQIASEGMGSPRFTEAA